MSEVINIFEEASRKKVRFGTKSGVLDADDLWDLPLESLDELAKSLNKQVKESTEESFIKPKTVATDMLNLKFEIVKHIIKVRLEEDALKAAAKERRLRKQKIMAALEAADEKSLANKSVEELRKELEEIGD